VPEGVRTVMDRMSVRRDEDDHPFVDGNKRTALMTALIFPGLNGRSLDAEDDELTELVVGVASGRVGKAQTAFFRERNSRPRRK